MDKNPEISKELETALKAIIDQFDQEEQPVRERQIRLWKKLEYYWAGFTRIYWSETAHDWRVSDYASNDDESSYYDKQINVFRAFLETLIAAMSSSVPAVRCIPDDADNQSDVSTAKAGNKIAELIYKYSDANLLWIRALWVYCTQGMVAAYNYSSESTKFGTVNIAKFEDVEEDQGFSTCPLCKQEIDPDALGMALTEADEFQPDDEDVKSHDFLNEGKLLCSQCQALVDPELQTRKVVITRMTGITSKPKARQIIEVNGGLYVKVPNYARDQAGCPYLAYEYETHYSNVLQKYPELRDKFVTAEGRVSSSSGSDMYERWGRLSPQYYGEYPISTPTVRNWWLRPVAFELISDEELRKEAKRKFPDGCKAVWINDDFAEAIPEALDDHWTLTYNPLSEYIHFDPHGLLLVSIQDITQDLIALTLQTIEHGVPTTFADPKFVDFEAYRNMEVVPGGLYPAKATGGKAIGDGFFTLQTANLSKEVGPFGEKIEELGQFVSGALPSLSGGDQGNSSRTAAQYSMSRNQALQRLQTPWKMINAWWKNTFAKVIPQYIDTMLDDERIVRSVGNSFVNDVIKKAQLDGKIGDVTLTSTDELPMTLGQMKDTLMQLMQVNNPAILAALASPENLEILSEVIGLDGFSIPGQSDRDKQYEEIAILVTQQPINGMMSSVQPDQLVDNHMVEASICRDWAVSEAGRMCKIENEAGYQNVLLHMKEHLMIANPPQQMGQPQGQPNPAQGNPQQQQGNPQQGKLIPIGKKQGDNGNAASA